MKDRIAKSVFWIVWSRGVVHLVSLLSVLVVARLLDPADYGLMALAAIWTSTLALIAELGLGPAIVQFQGLQERELNCCFWLTMGVAWMGYAALYGAAPKIAAWFDTPRLSDVLRAVGLSLPLAAVRLVPDSLLRKRLELDRIAQAEIAGVVTTLPVVLGLAWSGAGVWALVAGTLVMPLVQTIVSFWFVRWRPGLRMGSTRLREILRYSWGAMGARAGWAAYQQVDAVVLGKVAGEVALGFYSMAKLLASLPVDKVSVVANQLALPIMAGLQADLATMRVSFLRGLRLVACVTIPSCVGMALVAEDFVVLALTDKWTPMIPLLQVLCLFGLIRSLDVLLPPVLFARYRTGFLFWWTAALLVVMPVVLWAGAAWRGALGVALALIAVYPVIMAWMGNEALGELELGWRSIWVQLRPILIATVIMAGFVLAIRWILPVAGSVDRLVRLGLAVGLGALTYALVILRLGGALVSEVFEVTGWLFPRRHVLSRSAATTFAKSSGS